MLWSPSKLVQQSKGKSDILEPPEIHLDQKKIRSTLFSKDLSSIEDNNFIEPPNLNRNQISEDSETEEVEDEIVYCGRIPFKKVKLDPDAPADLVCEECEKRFSIYCCTQCEQVFCKKCADLCHPRGYDGELMHPHEANGKIRSIRYGDTSRIKLSHSFQLPNVEIYEDELLLVKDLSVPNTLTTVPRNKREKKSEKVFTAFQKFDVNQRILFTDPQTKCRAFGVIISQWDFRNSEAAPPIIRGGGSFVWYIVQMQGLMEQLNGNLEILLDKPKPPSEVEFPVIEGVSSVQIRGVMMAANEVNRRIAELQSIKRLGPKYHLRRLERPNYTDEFDAMDANDALKFDRFIDSVAEHGEGRNEDYTGFYDYFHHLKEKRLKEEHERKKTLLKEMAESAIRENSLDLSVINESKSAVLSHHSRNQKKGDSPARKTVDRDFYKGLDLNVYADNFSNLNQAEFLITPDFNPLPASMRSYEDVLDKSLLQHEKDRNGIPFNPNARSKKEKEGVNTSQLHYLHQALNVLILHEDSIESVDHFFQELNGKKTKVLQDMVDKKLYIGELGDKMWGFSRWKEETGFSKTTKEFYNARKIQTRVRIWLCRNVLDQKAAEWHQELEKRRIKLHSLFRIREPPAIRATSVIDPVFTFDNKMYFPTKHDMNRYGAFLRMTVSKVVRFMNRRKLTLYRRAFDHWKSTGVGNFLEKNLLATHFRKIEVDAMPPIDDFFIEQKRRALEELKSVQLVYKIQNPTDYHTATNIPYRFPSLITFEGPSPYPPPSEFALTAAVRRQLSEKFTSTVLKSTVAKLANTKIDSFLEEIKGDKDVIERKYREEMPPYFPSHDIKLPALPNIFIPNNAESRLRVKKERRLNYCDYGDLMSGPTFDSNWVIPDMLLMGPMPWTAAETDNSVKLSSIANKAVQVAINEKSLNGLGTALSEINQEVELQKRIKQREAHRHSSLIPEKSERPKLSSISSILLHGIDTFISLMPKHEEDSLEILLRIPSIEEMIQRDLSRAKVSVSRAIMDLNNKIHKQNEQISEIPIYGKTDPRYPASYRERLRCQARIKLAEEAIKKAKHQIKNLQEEVHWERIPLTPSEAPPQEQILPLIWRIEKLLSKGRRIYLYSRDGHGRAGMVSAILLGRGYLLHPYEAMYRVQTAHDSSKREENRKYPITTPQLPCQRQLVADILHTTNRPLEHLSYRAQLDEETFVDKTSARPVVNETNVILRSATATPPVHTPVLTPMQLSRAHSRKTSSYSMSMQNSTLVDNSDLVSNVSLDDISDRGGILHDNVGLGLLHDPLLEARIGTQLEMNIKLEDKLLDMDLEDGKIRLQPKLKTEEKPKRRYGDNTFIVSNSTESSLVPGSWAGSSVDSEGNEHKRQEKRVLPDEPTLKELYEDNFDLGQSKDLIRNSPVKKQDPAASPGLPLLRQQQVDKNVLRGIRTIRNL